MGPGATLCCHTQQSFFRGANSIDIGASCSFNFCCNCHPHCHFQMAVCQFLHGESRTSKGNLEMLRLVVGPGFVYIMIFVSDSPLRQRRDLRFGPD